MLSLRRIAGRCSRQSLRSTGAVARSVVVAPRIQQRRPFSQETPARPAGKTRAKPEGQEFFAQRPGHPDAPLAVRWTFNSVKVFAGPSLPLPVATLDAATLRDDCACPLCRDTSSGQKKFASHEVPSDIRITNIRHVDEALVVTFDKDIPRLARDTPHEATIPIKTLENCLDLSLGGVDVHAQTRTGVMHWDKEVLERSIRRIDYHDYMQEDDAFWDALIDLNRLGIVYLKNVPQDEDSVVKITTRIANIRETFYGRTFDVRAKPNAENIAYTSDYLGLHQDLLYLRPPPKIQVLHCMENSCNGGESLFSDSDRIGSIMAMFEESGRINELFTFPVPYAYLKNGHNYWSFHTVLSPTRNGTTNARWSPPFQGRWANHGTWERRPGRVARWMREAQVFEHLINEDRAVWTHRMQPGECVLFDNLRVMHGRRAFDAEGGSRWLRGAYISYQDLRSRSVQIPQEKLDRIPGGLGSLAQRNEHLRQSPWFREVESALEKLEPAPPRRQNRPRAVTQDGELPEQ